MPRADYKKRGILTIEIIILFIILQFLFSNLRPFLVENPVTVGWINVIFAFNLIVFFYLVDWIFDVRFKNIHYALIAFIALGGFIFGPLCYAWEYYDKFLHIVSPVMAVAIIFYIIRNLKINLRWKLAFSYFTVAGILGMFEVEEFLLDKFFNSHLQGVFIVKTVTVLKTMMDPLTDTHMDLMLGFSSALVYCLIVYFYHRSKRTRNL